MACRPHYVKVWLPLKIDKSLYYRVPPHLQETIAIGKRVLVPFHKSGVQWAIVVECLESLPEELPHIYEVLKVIDEHPILPAPTIALYQWIASYYLCTYGDVLRCALPQGFYVKVQKYITLSQTKDKAIPKNAKALLYFLERSQKLSWNEALAYLPKNRRNKLLEQLLKENIVQCTYEAQPQYKPLLRTAYRLKKEHLKTLIALAQKAPKTTKRYEGLHILIQSFTKNEVLLRKTILEKGVPEHLIKELLQMGLLEVERLPISRLSFKPHTSLPLPLNPAQKHAIECIQQQWQQQKPVLLYGITASGKTHVYIALIQETLKQNKQVLYLVPEIALTKQLIERLQTYIDEPIGVYHSRLSSAERTELWYALLENRIRVVVGVRSAVFLPFNRLGLIIVDEEHDRSFKQQDTAPRYHAKDVALYMGQIQKAQVLLGSATPSLESYYWVKQGKYGYVTLKERPFKVHPPKMLFVNMRHEVQHHLNYGLLSSVLIEHIEKVLQRGEQVVLFRNRRGYAPYLLCKHCGAVIQCRYCDIALTYHKSEQQLRCHYCGYQEPYSELCPECQQETLQLWGIGTEQVEEHLKKLFPKYRIARMDLDTTRGKYRYIQLIDAIEKGEIQILVGTQMVTKGLDFERVTLVAVLDADQLLYFPDFRTLEYAYQTLKQFQGRAGRRTQQGTFIIQTTNPDHPLLQHLDKDIDAFYEILIKRRKERKYPPFVRLIRIETRHKDLQQLKQSTLLLSEALREHFGKALIGPSFPPIMRLKQYYRMHLLIRLPLNKKSILKKAKTYLKTQIERLGRGLQVIIDVDPR